MLNRLRDLAASADRLPDATKLKTWSDVFISIISAPTTFVAGTIAGALGFFQWWLPYTQAETNKRELARSAVHVSVIAKAELIKTASVSLGGTKLIPLSISIDVQNKTPREFRITDSMWTLNGVELITPSPQLSDPRVLKDSSNSSNGSINASSFSSYSEKYSLLARGSVFGGDNVIRPSETLRRSFIVYAPARQYAYLKVSLALPIIALSAAESLEASQYTPRLLYLTDQEPGLFEWRLCPKGASIETGLNANPGIRANCMLVLSRKHANPDARELPSVSPRDYLVSIVTVELPSSAGLPTIK